ncbi:MAG: cobalamin-dependent protein [Candidatus Omnitrophica bacterium]|nr:cobalamin-dependent protein [Candidatus Omnitrophota bacterium]
MTEKKNITLISLNDYLALGSRNISSFLKESGYKVDIIFFRNMISNEKLSSAEIEEDLLIDLVRRLDASIVGISVCSPYFKTASQVTQRIQEELKIPVIWGGVHPTIMPEQSIKVADMICVGEGEQFMLELMQNLSERKSIDKIKGLWIRKNGEIIKGEDSAPIQNLDTLSYPDYSNEGKYFIEANNIYEGDPALFEDKGLVGSWRKGLITLKNEYYMLASRGCPFRCAYCCNSFLHKKYLNQDKVVRWRSVGNVIGEIISITKRFPKIKKIQFYDALFPWDRDWVSEFCREYKRHVNRPFYVSTHPHVLKKENLAMLKEAGVEIVGFGIESGCEKVRREIYDRDVSDLAIINAAKVIHDQKIEPHYYIILDNPFEDWQDRKAGLDLLLKLPRPFILIIHSLYLFPKVEVTRRVLSLWFGKLSDKEIEDWLFKQSQFGMDFTTNPINDLFWKSLYSLTAKSFVPKFLIRSISNSRFFQKHPKIVVMLAKLCDYIKFAWTGATRLLKRNISLKNIKNNLSLSQFADTYH